MDEGRFGRLWAEWDRRVDAGERPADILGEAKDEDLVEVLAGESDQDRRYARDIIATELLNRLHARSRDHPEGASKVVESAEAAHDVAQGSQEAIHKAEGILKQTGEWDLGASVSASAYASLDATQAAFDVAKEQSEALQGSLAQSRSGAGLAKEAAHAADEGREITRDLEKKMSEIGRGKEGREASEAARDVQEAAHRAEGEAVDRERAGRRRPTPDK